VSARTRNLLLAGGLVIAAGFVAVNLLSLEPASPTRSFTTPAPGGRMASPEPGSGAADLSAGGGQATKGSASEQVAQGGPGSPLEETADVRGYALPVAELSGLPGDAPPGTELELWVTWDPPVTERPRLQRLIRRVVLEKVAPAVTPDGPDAAILLVPVEKLPDLVYADRYGAISVALLARRS
jgi:hypothetical protein